MKMLARFSKDEAGATAIEYCIIASFVSIAILLTVNGLGTTLNATYTKVSTALK